MYNKVFSCLKMGVAIPNGYFMEHKVVKIRIHPVLMKRFKMICIERDLSVPKQTAELVRAFVESYEPTNRKI
jgi:intein-encoded DNA endonuclease-like protein